MVTEDESPEELGTEGLSETDATAQSGKGTGLPGVPGKGDKGGKGKDKGEKGAGGDKGEGQGDDTGDGENGESGEGGKDKDGEQGEGDGNGEDGKEGEGKEGKGKQKDKGEQGDDGDGKDGDENKPDELDTGEPGDGKENEDDKKEGKSGGGEENLIGRRCVIILPAEETYHGKFAEIIKIEEGAFRILLENKNTIILARQNFAVVGDKVVVELNDTGERSVETIYWFREKKTHSIGIDLKATIFILPSAIIKLHQEEKDKDKGGGDKGNENKPQPRMAAGAINKERDSHGRVGEIVEWKEKIKKWEIFFSADGVARAFDREEFVIVKDNIEFYDASSNHNNTGGITGINSETHTCSIKNIITKEVWEAVPIADILRIVSPDNEQPTDFVSLEILKQIFSEYGMMLDLSEGNHISVYAKAMFPESIHTALNEIWIQHTLPEGERDTRIYELDTLIAKRIISIIVDLPEYFESGGVEKRFYDAFDAIGGWNANFSTTLLNSKLPDAANDWAWTFIPFNSVKGNATSLLVIPNEPTKENSYLSRILRADKNGWIVGDLPVEETFYDGLRFISRFREAKEAGLVINSEYNTFAIARMSQYLRKLSDAI